MWKILNNMQVDKYCKIKAVDLNVFFHKKNMYVTGQN